MADGKKIQSARRRDVIVGDFKRIAGSLAKPEGTRWFVQAVFPERGFQSREGFDALVDFLWELQNRFTDWGGEAPSRC